MRKRYCLILVVIFLIGLQSCLQEEIVFNSEPNSELELSTILKLNEKECSLDFNENSLRFPIENNVISNFSPFIEFQDYSDIYFEGKALVNNSINNLGSVEINKRYAIEIKTQNTTQQFHLTFTNLPIVQIVTPNKIYDEPKSLAKITVNYASSNKASDTFFIGIEHRGGTSQSYQKKSFGFSLKANANLNEDISSSFFNMKINNDWILDAMWIDKSRLRNKTSFEIWNNIKGNNNYGIDNEFVELYINNEHQGLYSLNENINSEFLNLTNPNDVLYKATAWENGATRFETLNSSTPFNYYWDGWEQKHPDNQINWKPLNELRNLVVNNNDNVFASKIESLISLDNFIDYYIFLNITYASDNTGKNTFLLKEASQNKFFIVPWDIDGSWGIKWDGTAVGYSSNLSNNLFDRLLKNDINNFKAKTKQRWLSLRENELSNDEIKKIFTNHFSTLNKSDIINIENKKWNENIDLDTGQEYIENWIDNRILYLDNYFNTL